MAAGADVFMKLTLAIRTGNVPQASSLLPFIPLKQMIKVFKINIRGERFKTSIMHSACKGTLPQHTRIACLIMERYEQILTERASKNKDNGRNDESSDYDKEDIQNPAFILDDSDNSALFYACTSCKLEVIQKVLDGRNADINFTGRNGETPLHWCCSVKFVPAVKYLIEEKKADPTVKNEDGKFPLALLLSKESTSPAEGVNTIMYDDSISLATCITDQNLQDVIPMLLPKKSSEDSNEFINIQFGNGIAILHVLAACEVPQGAIKQLLTFEEMSPLTTDENGYTPINVACYQGIVQNLEELFHDMEIKKDVTGLRMAIIKGQIDVTEYLITKAHYSHLEIYLHELQKVTKSQEMKLFLKGILLHQKNRNFIIAGNVDIVQHAVCTGKVDVVEFVLLNCDAEIGEMIGIIEDVLKNGSTDNTSRISGGASRSIDSGVECNSSSRELKNDEDKERNVHKEKRKNSTASSKSEGNGMETEEIKPTSQASSRMGSGKTAPITHTLNNAFIEGKSDISTYIRGVVAGFNGKMPEKGGDNGYQTFKTDEDNDKAVVDNCLQKIQDEAGKTWTNAIQKIKVDFQRTVTDDLLAMQISEENIQMLVDRLDQYEYIFDVNESGVFAEVQRKISSLLHHHLIINRQAKPSNQTHHEFIHYTIFNLVAKEIGWKWKLLLQKLFKSYPKWYIMLLIKEIRNSHKESITKAFDGLMKWKAIYNSENFPLFNVLSEALESEGCNMTDVVQDLKQQISSLGTDKESLAKEMLSDDNLLSLASSLSGDGQNVLSHLGIQEDIWLSHSDNPAESLQSFLIKWKQETTCTAVESARSLAEACEKAHRIDLAESITADLENTDDIKNEHIKTLASKIQPTEWKEFGIFLGLHPLEIDTIEKDMVKEDSVEDATVEILTRWKLRTCGTTFIKLGFLIPVLYKINRGDLVELMGTFYMKIEPDTLSNDLLYNTAKGLTATDDGKVWKKSDLAIFARNLGYNKDEVESVVQRLFPEGEQAPTNPDEWCDIIFGLLQFWKTEKAVNLTKTHMTTTLLGAVDLAGKLSLAQKFKRKLILQQSKDESTDNNSSQQNF